MKYTINDKVVLSRAPEGPLANHLGSFTECISEQGYAANSLWCRSALAGGGNMLTQAVESHLAVRRAAGFTLKSEGRLLQSFATFSDESGNSTSVLRLPSRGLARHNRLLNELADSVT